MAAPMQFNVTYYVSMVLAYGGTLFLESDRLVFMPGAVERAVGVSNTEIPHGKIKMVEVTGTITESLVIRTAEKAYRFVGSVPHKIKEMIELSLESSARAPVSSAPPASSPTPAAPAASAGASGSGSGSASAAHGASSTEAVKKAPVSSACPGCKAPVRPEFLFCPHCSTVLKLSCGVCRKVAESGWKYCAYCGVTFSA